MDEFGKAEAAFGRNAQQDATKAARAAFGPSPAQTPASPALRAKSAAQGPGTPMADALRGTYEQLMEAARATANRYARFGTNGAARQEQTIADAANEAVGAQAAQAAQNKAASPSASAYRMLAEPSYARGGAMGANEQPTADLDGTTAFLGNVDANSREAMDAAAQRAREDLAWMRDNDYMDNSKVEGWA